MKKLSIALLVFFFLLSSCSKKEEPPKVDTSKSKNTVFICTGKYAKKYHTNPFCEGIQSCKGDIIEVEKSKVIDKELCGYCKNDEK